MLPPVLNSRSEGELVTGMHRYFFTNTDNRGYTDLFCPHQIKGSSSLSILHPRRYASSSVDTACSREEDSSLPCAVLKKLPRVFRPFFMGGAGEAFGWKIINNPINIK